MCIRDREKTGEGMSLAVPRHLATSMIGPTDTSRSLLLLEGMGVTVTQKLLYMTRGSQCVRRPEILFDSMSGVPCDNGAERSERMEMTQVGSNCRQVTRAGQLDARGHNGR